MSDAPKKPQPPYEVTRMVEAMLDLRYVNMLRFARLVANNFGPDDRDYGDIDDTETANMARSLILAAEEMLDHWED